MFLALWPIVRLGPLPPLVRDTRTIAPQLQLLGPRIFSVTTFAAELISICVKEHFCGHSCCRTNKSPKTKAVCQWRSFRRVQLLFRRSLLAVMTKLCLSVIGGCLFRLHPVVRLTIPFLKRTAPDAVRCDTAFTIICYAHTGQFIIALACFASSRAVHAAADPLLGEEISVTSCCATLQSLAGKK